MKLSKFSTLFVVGFATIAFVGLVVLQIQSLNKSIDTNKKIFRQRVHLASSAIATSFAKNPDYPKHLRAAARRLKGKNEINESKIDKIMRDLIDVALDDYGINIPYEYAVYGHKYKGEGFDFALGDAGLSLDFALESCLYPNERSHGWANLTCSSDPFTGDYHLALFFPEQDAFVFAQSRGALLLYISFILLLIGCFAYTLFIIRRQKKHSEIKNDFINNLTHEFKTPIASISLAANLLNKGDEKLDKDKKSNYLKLITQESKRLEGQVDKVLQIAMIDSGSFALDKKEMDLHTVIENVVESMSLTVEKRQGTIDLSLNAIDSRLVADSTHMVNIIYNLIDNALKYTTGAPRIVITTSNEADGIQISIKDNGIGIGEETQKYIFDKFYRAETGNIHNAKGFGLGLSYVKKIVEAHRGKIDLFSKLNQGSEFRLFIPTS